MRVSLPEDRTLVVLSLFIEEVRPIGAGGNAAANEGGAKYHRTTGGGDGGGSGTSNHATGFFCSGYKFCHRAGLIVGAASSPPYGGLV